MNGDLGPFTAFREGQLNFSHHSTPLFIVGSLLSKKQWLAPCGIQKGTAQKELPQSPKKTKNFFFIYLLMYKVVYTS